MRFLQWQLQIENYWIPTEMAERVAASLYSGSCTHALEDAVITDEEKAYLLELRAALGLSAETARQLESHAVDQRYLAAAESAMSDGIVTAQEAAELEHLRTRFGMTAKYASALVGEAAREGYLALFREVISDGRITQDEMDQLRQFRSALGISRGKANDIVESEAFELYRNWCNHVLQDGEISAEEERGIEWLKTEFALNPQATAKYDNQISEMKLLATYRRGDLPSINSAKLLKGVTCHLECRSRFEWRTATRSKDAEGELVLTSERLIFISPIRSFELSPSKIIDIVLFSNALTLRCSSNSGSGTYFLRNPDHVEAILVGLVRQHKLPQLCATFTSDRSRHIPDSVRRQVFIRDGGKCIQCGANYPIHYDHILPFSRGGGNTVENIQILCGPCNIRKSNKI